jgi:EmrB/QacA subfamily drug resistance transporter
VSAVVVLIRLRTKDNPMSPETESGQQAASPPATKGTGPVITGLMLAVFLGMLDQQIVATALPPIVGDLGGLDLFGWVTTAYIIASSVTVPIYGKLGDLFGRKGVFLVAIGLFLFGSLASGAAPSIELLILARLVQGLGAGGLFVTVFAIIGERFGPREGAKYYGYFAITFAAAALAGPFVGGVLTELLGWRSVFFFNLPFGLAALYLTSKYLNLPVHKRKPVIDYPGIALLSAGIISLTLLTSWGGTKYAWSSPVIIGLAVAVVVLFTAFVFVERRAVEPVIPPHLFRDTTFTLCVVLGLIAGAVFLGSVNFLALFVQIVTGTNPAISGLVLLPMMLGLVLASTLSSRWIGRSGRYKWYPVVSMALGIISTLLLATMDVNTSKYVALAYMVIFGVAAGLNVQVLAMAAQNTAPRKDIGAVSATVTFSRAIGTSLGISIFAAVFYGWLTSELSRDVPAGSLDGIDQNSLSSQQVLDGLPAQVLHGVRVAYSHALTPVFLTSCGLLVVGLILSLMLKDIPLRKSNREAPAEES